MCEQCDYTKLLDDAGVGITPNRLAVLSAVGERNAPLSAGDIFEVVSGTAPINRVTVYRILDCLVENGVLERISGGGRTFFYGIAPNEHHRPHPHFYCRQCGNMACLGPETLKVNADGLARGLPGAIENVEIRVDGICNACLQGNSSA